MHYPNLAAFLKDARVAGGPRLGPGPVALVIAEDDIELGTTIRHNLLAGFKTVLVFVPDGITWPDRLGPGVFRIAFDTLRPEAAAEAVNGVAAALEPGTWLYYSYNAEYLFYPFADTRTVGEMLAFHASERREAMLAYVIDLYAGDLGADENAVSLENAHLDRSGYYALGRKGEDGTPLERQLDFYGGLRWRYEEHVPEAKRRIDRTALFQAQPGRQLSEAHRLNEDELNTFACPWHNNLTAAICSFRTAKALRSNAGSRYEIDNFTWHNSVRFEWDSRQLLDLGLMEPGQWF